MLIRRCFSSAMTFVSATSFCARIASCRTASSFRSLFSNATTRTKDTAWSVWLRSARDRSLHNIQEKFWQIKKLIGELTTVIFSISAHLTWVGKVSTLNFCKVLNSYSIASTPTFTETSADSSIIHARRTLFQFASILNIKIWDSQRLRSLLRATSKPVKKLRKFLKSFLILNFQTNFLI